jgi:hypothetical protein
MDAAKPLQPDRRDIFLQRVMAMLKMRGRFSAADVDEISKLALCGLVHTNAA